MVQLMEEKEKTGGLYTSKRDFFTLTGWAAIIVTGLV